MAAKEIIFSSSARSEIAKGLNMLANAVKVTLGPRGRNVVIEKSWGAPTVTKDGVTVAKEIELENKFENMGAQMVKEVASKTSDVAGDGTTTATVLAQAIYNEGAKLVAAGLNPMDLKRGIDAAVAAVVEELKKLSTPTKGKDDIAQVGTISANGDTEIGNMIAEAMKKVGKEGVITVEEAKTLTSELDVVEGMQFDRGYLSPYFVTDSERMECVLNDVYILAHEKKISNMKELLPVLEQVAKQGKPLLIIAEDVDGEALATLVVNKLRGTLQVVRGQGAGLRRSPQGDAAGHRGAHRRPGDHRGSRPQAREPHARRSRPREAHHDRQGQHDDHRGRAARRTTIEARVKTIRREIEETTSDYDREKLQERLAKLVGGVAVIRVGAATEVEMKEKKARVEDAMHATRAAVEEGIVPGGGVALIRAHPGARQADVRRRPPLRRQHRAPRARGAAAPDRAATRASTARSSSRRSRRARARSASTPRRSSTRTSSRPA